MPLPAPLRGFYEPRLQHDLGHVRLHRGPKSEALNRRLAARAFTWGDDVWLGGGANLAQPSWLLAHELVHVLQHDGTLRRFPAGCPADADTPPIPHAVAYITDPDLQSIRGSIFEREHDALIIGDDGNAVQMLQDMLLNMVCTGIDRIGLHAERADARFGPATRAALRRFQQTHSDTIGRPLAADGKLGPLTLGAIDAELGLPVIDPPLDPEGTGDCFGFAKWGPGEARRLLPGQAPPFAGFQPNDVVWELSNFDVAKHFVKTEHRKFLRGDVVGVINALPKVDTRVRIIGEASTTAGPGFNQALSERRAACVRSALLDAGLDDAARIDPLIAYGETYAQVRRVFAGQMPIDGVEDRHARKVSIVLAVAPQECSEAIKVRGSTRFVARVACHGPISARLNIGDRSDPAHPTWRPFVWTHEPWPSGCTFIPGIPPFPPLFQNFETKFVFHLARRDPAEIYAPTEFAGQANHESSPSGRSALVGQVNDFHMPVIGFWIPSPCGAVASTTVGWLVPLGPVECGEVPAPPQADCDPRRSAEDCPDDYKKSAAQHYVGALLGASADASRILPPDWRMPLGLSGAFVALATTDLPKKQLMRVFLFLGGRIGTTSSGLDRLAAAGLPKTDMGSAVRLKNDDSRWLGDSDFRKLTLSKLSLKGASNRVELETGVKTLAFFGPHCHGRGTENYYGIFRPFGPPFCTDKLPDIAFPERECKEEEDCPESARLAGHRHLRIRVGRMTTLGLPPGLSRLGSSYGCHLVAAQLNIDTDADDGGPIQREFALLLRQKDCAFTVDRGDVDVDLMIKRRLATEEPDRITAPSDLAGGAMLDAAGELHVVPRASLMLSFKLPGAWDAACTGKRGALGVVVPTSVVDCGSAAEPEHDTRAERDHAASCEAYKAAKSPLVETRASTLKSGGYDRFIDALGAPPRIIVPPLDYEDWLIRLKPGDVIHDAFFVGKAPGTPPADSTKVVAFADLRIVAINTDQTMLIEFVSDLCAFDEHGGVVALRPNGCDDDFARAGQIKRTGTIRFGSDAQGPFTA